MTRRKTDEDVAGQRYGRLLVLGIDRSHPKQGRFVRVRCDCGTEKIARWNDMRRGTTKSCGCLARELARTNLSRVNKERNLRPCETADDVPAIAQRFARMAWGTYDPDLLAEYEEIAA